MKGGDPKTYAKVNSMDVDTMSDYDVLKQQFVNAHPHVDRAEAEQFFKMQYDKKYGYDEDFEDEDSAAYKKQQMKFDASSARAELKKTQDDLKVLDPQDPKKGRGKSESRTTRKRTT